MYPKREFLSDEDEGEKESKVGVRDFALTLLKLTSSLRSWALGRIPFDAVCEDLALISANQI
jgi:hypothetical protein